MEARDKHSYEKCVNCGKYIDANMKDKSFIKNKSLYCCEDCYQKFLACSVCTRYYPDTETHTTSLKCRIKFDLNAGGKPYIKSSSIKLLVISNPSVNVSLIAEKLSLVLKLPLFIGEQYRLENQTDPSKIIEDIEEKIGKGNSSNGFIYLSNSYNPQVLSGMLEGINFDRVIHIYSDIDIENLNICSVCGNINSFGNPDSDNNIKCLICGNISFSRAGEEVLTQQKFKNYDSCVTLLKEKGYNLSEIDYTAVSETVNKISAQLLFN